MTVTLVLTESIFSELLDAAQNPLETAGVMLARIVPTGQGSIRLLAGRIMWVESGAYLTREHDRLTIASDGYVPALSQAESLGITPIWVHTHPGVDGIPLPSEKDDLVNHQISDVFRLRSGSPYYGSLVVSLRAGGLAFSGYLESEDGLTIRIDRLWMVGDRFRLIRAFDSDLAELSPVFDRSVRAFGVSIQRTLGDICVGLIGCGGTGSVVAEQLTRLGVRRIILVDPEEISESNVTRVYGSAPLDVGKPKVDVLAQHLVRIAPDARPERIQSMLTVQSAARGLVGCDVVFGCTDDNAGRLILSRAATYLLIPVIDCGVLITSHEDGRLQGIDARVTVLGPGQACLICRGRIDLRRAAAELLTPDERRKREDEGYAPALGETEPAVVAFTTLIGAAAVSELLERLIGYGPEPRPSEVLFRCHEREISTNLVSPQEGHYCHPSSGKLGLGITEPFLEQTWQA